MSSRRSIWAVVNIVVALALAVLVIVVNRPWEVWSFDSGFLGVVVAALLLEGLLIVVWAQRHALVLRAVGSPVEPRSLGWIVAFSGTVNSLTPAATGEIARAWLLNRQFDVPYERAGGAIVFERFFMLGFMAVTAFAFGLIAAGSAVWAVVASWLVVVGYVVLTPLLVGPLARRAGRQVEGGRIKKMTFAVIAIALETWRDRRTALATAAWSAAAFAITGVIFALAAGQSGLEIDPISAWAVIGGATVGGVVSALPFGLGAAELSAVGIGVLLGRDPQNVAAAFVVYRIIFTLPIALIGVVAYTHLMAGSPKEVA